LFTSDETLARFSVHQVTIYDTTYLLLPKLCSVQMDMIRRRLAGLGYKVRQGAVLRASKGGTSLVVSSRGVCWSNDDPADAILPQVPSLLNAEKQPVSLGHLQQTYFSYRKKAGGFVLRFECRLEQGRTWTGLRAAGRSALTPDEVQVMKRVLAHARGSCTAWSDYPADGSKVRHLGRRNYYESRMDVAEFAENLRPADSLSGHGAYLPSDCLLQVEKFRSPSEAELVLLFGSLGEWCYYYPFRTPQNSIS
jgi:hypothetical protein